MPIRFLDEGEKDESKIKFLDEPSNVAPESSGQQASIEDFIRSQQAGPLTKLATSGAGLIDALIAGPVAAATRLPGAVARGFETDNPNTSIPYIGGQLNNAQTLAESGARLVFDLGSTINQLGSKVLRDFSQNPIESSINALVAPISPLMQLYNLRSRTPNQQQIDNFLEDQLRSTQTQAVKTQPLLPEVLGEADIQAADDIASASTLIPAVGPTVRGIKTGAKALTNLKAPRILTNLAENRAPATLSQVAESTLDFTPEQVAQSVPTAVQRVRQVVGKEIPTTAREGISALDKTEKEILNQRLAINEAADNRGLIVNGNQALDSARSVLDEIKIITNAEKDKILKKAEELYSGERPPTDGQLVQMQLNEKLKGFYNAEDPIEGAQLKVDLAIRDSYAQQMDEISQIMTGRAESPYSDIGAIIETRNALRKTLDQIEGTEANKKTGLKKGASKIPLTRTGMVAKGADTVLSQVQKNQLRKLNEATQRIFSEGEASIVSPEIPAQTLEELLSSKTRTGTNPQPIRF